VACAHVDFEDERAVVALQRAEFSDVFGGFQYMTWLSLSPGLDEDAG